MKGGIFMKKVMPILFLIAVLSTITLTACGGGGDDATPSVSSPSLQIHISYYDNTNGDLKYATNASGVWVTVTVDSVWDVGYHTSLALDSSGKAHISYYDYTNSDLKYATNASGAWVITAVDSGGDMGRYNSLKVR
jgi:hypothetical protein